MPDRNKAIEKFFEENPECTTPSECDKKIAEEFECTEKAARSARYRVFPKGSTRPWNRDAKKSKTSQENATDGDTWFEGKEKAVPTYVDTDVPGRARLVFQDEYPRTELPHECPKTGAVARSVEEADKLFGWRKTGEYEDGTPKYIVQSWCRKARADKAKETKNTN